MMKLTLIFISLIFLSLKFNNYFMKLLIIMNIFFMVIMTLYFNNFFNYYWNLIYYNMGMDNLSFSMIILNLWICNLAMLSNNKLLIKNNLFMQIMIFLMMCMNLTFLSMNIMFFYIFFEISLIPIILIIMGWGYQIDRIQASMYMMFYTLYGSLPLLMMIIFIYKNNFSLMFNILNIKNFLNLNNMFYFLMLNLAFFIKMPLYLVHLWLPKAHVEAPIMGSMILAGIMLKLGSYGLYRFMLILPYLYMNFNKFMIIINILGGLICCFICLNQSDMKIIIAYSSVVHMNLMMASMMCLMTISFKSSILMMIAHGLCSSGMFFIVNLMYERLKSRNIFINKNLINIMPSLTLWWFLMCSSNFSAPPSLNLISEIMIFNSLIQWNYYLMIFIVMFSFFSTSYSIFLYSFSQYGKINYSLYNFKFIKCNEFNMMIMHWLPLNLLFLNLNLFIF